MEILVCLAALPLLLIAPLVEAWQRYREHRDHTRDALRACELLYGPAPRTPADAPFMAAGDHEARASDPQQTPCRPGAE